jgi:hypothetical protein
MAGYVIAYVFPGYVNFFNEDIMDTHLNTSLNVAARQMAKKLERLASHDQFKGNSREIEAA